MMVGLSIVLEGQKSVNYKRTTPQVINKTTMTINRPPPPPQQPYSPSCDFLQQCFLCGQRLLPGKDIYMYKGDEGFCSEECRCRQIYMDEEEGLMKESNCSFSAAVMMPSSSSPSPSASGSSSTSSSPPPSRHRKSSRNRAGGFAIY